MGPFYTRCNHAVKKECFHQRRVVSLMSSAVAGTYVADMARALPSESGA